ncbi:hypothetical protein [Celerinatantimonas yamalensis]|uniref:Uncharacterized protein n=1 Tax=Celerinatantimonas yamalensis TaxID=559956 RepID=A0ABW9G357_9GAMM
MNRLLLSATATLFAGQALGHSQQPLATLQMSGFKALSAVIVAGLICYTIRYFRRH